MSTPKSFQTIYFNSSKATTLLNDRTEDSEDHLYKGMQQEVLCLPCEGENEVDVSKHILAKKIEIDAPKYVLNMQNIHHDVMMMQTIYHAQLRKFKQFYAQQ